MIVAIGGVGGIVNALQLHGNTLVWPRLRKDGLDVGFLGNILYGVVAAFLPYLLGIASLSQNQQMGISLVSAIGGSSFITTFIQRREVDLSNKKLDAVSDDVTKLVDQLLQK